MSRTDTAASRPPAKAYNPTPEELTALHTLAARKQARPPAPKLKITKKGKAVQVGPDHPDPNTGWFTLENAFGTTSNEFTEGILSQLINAGTHGQDLDGKAPNFMLSVIHGIGPRDEAECMLAAQMAAVHMATMTFARRLAHVDNIAQQDSAQNAFNKLARTFAVQMEALKRYRTGGEQRVTVQHVTVNEGGQAIVGTVSASGTGTGGAENRETTS
jgi:hypothetical protein